MQSRVENMQEMAYEYTYQLQVLVDGILRTTQCNILPL
jgi:hypothetical protein